jgi:hypothetical protein
METALPSNKKNAKAGMAKHLGPDEYDRDPVPVVFESVISPGVHSHADHIHPRQNRRPQRMEKKEKDDIHSSGNLGTPHGQTPELRPAFLRRLIIRQRIHPFHILQNSFDFTKDYA